MHNRMKHASRLCLFVALFLALTCSWRVADAQVGNLLYQVTLPAQTQCQSGFGTSVTIVPGFLVGLPQYPMLLVTSCYSGGGQAATLYFLPA